MNNKDTPMYSGNSKELEAVSQELGAKTRQILHYTIHAHWIFFFFTNQTFIKNILKPKSYFMVASAGFSIIALELCL